MAVWAGTAWVVLCLVAIVVAKRSERGFLLFGFLIAATAMAIAQYTSRGLADRPPDTESAEYIELRNHSSSSLEVTGAGNRTVVRGGGRTFVRVEHAVDGPSKWSGSYCPPDVVVSAADGSTRFEIYCSGRPLTVLTWDGSEAYSDPHGEPYLLDSRRSRVLAGFAGGVAALALAALGERLLARRHPSAHRPASAEVQPRGV